ncbi:hypothetical protein D9M73_240250 [compost metagenome]
MPGARSALSIRSSAQQAWPARARQSNREYSRFIEASGFYCTTTLTVRVVPWLVVIVAVGAAVGMIVVLLLTARRQRPVSATVAVPKVWTPVVVVTRTVTVLPVVTDEVPLMSQL